jgi:hypothetical protein
MFQDQLTRSSMGWLGWYIGWERYSMMTAGVLGLAVAAAANQRAQAAEARDDWTMQGVGLPTAVQQSEQLNDIAKYILVVAGQRHAATSDATASVDGTEALTALSRCTRFVALSVVRFALAIDRIVVGSS